MDFIFTSGFDWMMAAFMLICAILLVLPVGETMLDYLTPKDNFNNKQIFKGETWALVHTGKNLTSSSRYREAA